MATIISRDDAQAAGMAFYFTGVRCKRGHEAPRYVSNGTCRDCGLRHRAPGPSTGSPNVRVLPAMAFHPSYAAPNDGEVIALGAIVQRSIDDALRVVRLLMSTGLDFRQIAKLATNGGPPLLTIADGAASPRAVPRMTAPDIKIPIAQPRVDPLTGLLILTEPDASGKQQEQYRPDPYK